MTDLLYKKKKGGILEYDIFRQTGFRKSHGFDIHGKGLYLSLGKGFYLVANVKSVHLLNISREQWTTCIQTF